MDDSSLFHKILDGAIKKQPELFVGFDRTKNVQDQLIEMLPKRTNWRLSGCENCEMVLYVHPPISSTTLVIREGTFKADTPEQALIQGVMYELYNLRWDGGWKEE